ncbi:MAG TPA: Holliday junction resolvase RuvX [Solirubrobacteraceae bacterium]|nr:Holliday junction resolvase RuvX [Solirubrobacteraceae bacterium]
MRVLALDYGHARCGVAVSDPTGTLATPLEPVLAAGTRRGLRRVAQVVDELGAERVVVGLPVSLSGGDSRQTRETREFAERLRGVVDVPVELYDERFTTSLAAQAGGEAALDSRAAAVLLDEWLNVGRRSADRGGKE